MAAKLTPFHGDATVSPMRPFGTRGPWVVATLAFGLLLGLAPAAFAQNTGKQPTKAAVAKDDAAPKAAKPAAKPSKAAAKPKPAAKKTTTPAKKAPRKPGSEPGQPDEAVRRVIAGTSSPPGSMVDESPELRAMREIDRALFPQPGDGAPWPSDTLGEGDGPSVHSSGLPPDGAPSSAPDPAPVVDLAWLKNLEMPDIPVRWDARVVRYLEYYKNDKRGRGEVAVWIKKSGRYGAAIRKALREQGAPEDLLWLSLVESGFNPTVFSHAGAAGLWQFMPEGGRIYGLTVDRWVDERLDPERSTVAAARYLLDLKQRFGSWELAFAAYNMGFGGVLAAIRKYNTNDYWELSRYEAGVPYETALYVPKIIAMAVVARNRQVFGAGELELDAPVQFDQVSVGSGISVQAVASASGVSPEAISALNPQLIAARTPPLASAGQARAWVVRVPVGSGARAAKSLPGEAKKEPSTGRYTVRWGESLDDVAARFGTTSSALTQLNGLRRDEVVRPRTVLLVPAGASPKADPVRSEKTVVVVPPATPGEAAQTRVFYRVVKGDTLRDVAAVFGAGPGDLARWNAIDPSAALHEGMTLQVYVSPRARLDDVVVLHEDEVRALTAGTTEFLDYCEAQKGRKRLEISARSGDTWSSISRRYGVSLGNLERINQRSRSSVIHAGDHIVVYVPLSRAAALAPAAPAPQTSSSAEGSAEPALTGEPVGDDGDARSDEDDDAKAQAADADDVSQGAQDGAPAAPSAAPRSSEIPQ